MSFLKKLLGRKRSKPDQSDLPIDATLRERVIHELAQACPGLEFSAAPDDPAKICATENKTELAMLDISNLAGQIRAYSDMDIDASVTRYVNAFAASQNPETNLSDDTIYPALRPMDYVKAVKAENPDIVTAPFHGDLHIIYLADNPDSMQAVSEQDLETGTITARSPKALGERALQNLHQWLPRLVCDSTQQVMHLYYVKDNPLLTSGMALLPEFWQLLERRHGSEFLFALPRKDQLFVFEPSFHKQLTAAKMLINATWEDNFNLLSPMTFKWVDGEIEVLGKL